MDEQTSKPDQRAGKDRRKIDDPAYRGPERRESERRTDKPAPK